MSIVLFCLSPCCKCDYIKEQITSDKIKIVTLSNNFSDWAKEDIKIVDEYNVLEDLRITAPILVKEDKSKLVGQLRIQRWINNGFR